MRYPGTRAEDWAGWLLGLIPLWYQGGGSIGRSWASWLLGLIPLGLLGRAGWPEVLGLGPRYPQWVPTMPPFSCQGGRSSPVGKKMNQVDRHIIGNSLPLMLLNFQRKFCNFFVIALDAIGSFVSILRFRSSYKRRVGEEIGYLTGYPRSIVEVG